ncbi:putative kinetochore protein NDC80 [Golovinomyces cichoracearum]|uniref:Kinetochore protein NDC80 n=1 Tax=Golovinomyces cichoracearum TaxID=62708 RepID=A0A420IM27_9PEZI|nr:putative kinetochore protein NDC80 [Golovinomyces cichoracearum]
MWTMGGVNHNSSLPQPASSLRRSSSISGMNAPFTAGHTRSMSTSRQSLAPSRPSQPQFHRSTSVTNIAETAGMSSVKRLSVQGNSGRKSYAPGSASHQSEENLERRSSVYRSRNSTNGPTVHQSFFQKAPQSAGIQKDPRPLKDRSYQAKIGQELLDYMAANNFEMEMKHHLTQNSIKSPTAKDFNYMFQWLYHRIDPCYRFKKNIDQEVPPILSQLRYPFHKSITKSSLAAVGSANSWHLFLGLLHWMMQLSQMLENYGANLYDDACAEAGVDVSGDRIIFDFLSKAYRDWLLMDEEAHDDDQDRVLAPHINSMAKEFEISNSRYLEELQILEDEQKRLQKDIKVSEKFRSDISTLDRNFKIMEEDKFKFEEFENRMNQKSEKYEVRDQFLQEEIDKVMIEWKEANDERLSLQQAVDDQGISMNDIDRMTSERERLQKGIDVMSLRIDETKRKVAEKEADAEQKLEELEKMVEKYNSLGYQIGLIPMTAPNAKGINYELHIIINSGPCFSTSQMCSGNSNVESDRLLADATTGYLPAHILNLDLRSDVRKNLACLRKDVSERRTSTMDEIMKHHDLLDGVKEALEDKLSEVEALEHRVRSAEEEYEKTREIITTQNLESDTQIEKMEKELAKMRSGLSESVQVMEQREMNSNIEYEQLTLRANSLREELHTKIEKMLNDIIKFKVHIQKNLEEYENFVLEEVEQELGNTEDDDKICLED